MDALLQEMLARQPEIFSPAATQRVAEQAATDDDRTRAFHKMVAPEPGPAPATPLPPKLAMLLGQAADSASTLGFLKAGHRKEANPALSYFNDKPWTVIPSAVAGSLLYSTLYDRLHAKTPKVANTLAGLLGGFHGALAGNNIEASSPSSYHDTARDLRLPSRR